MADGVTELSQRSKAAIGALLSVIDINFTNLHRLKSDIPDHYLCKELIETAFASKSPKDLTPALLKQISSDFNSTVNEH
jgi:hypothetical protein